MTGFLIPVPTLPFMRRLPALAALLFSASSLPAQDRLPSTQLVYSPAFQISATELRDTSLTYSFDGSPVQIPNIKEGNGKNIRPSGVINITTFGAIPNDGIDDTQAIIKAYTTLVRAAENEHNEFYFDYYRADFNRDGKFGKYNNNKPSEFGAGDAFAGVDLNGNGILETSIDDLPEVADMDGDGITHYPDGSPDMVTVQSLDRDGNVITIELPEERDLNHNYVIDAGVSVPFDEVEEVFRGFNDPRFQDGYGLSYALYIPDGVWDISDTIIFDGPEPVPAQRQHGAEGAPGVTNIRIYGQSRGAVLRLADNSPGFDNPAAPKPILTFSSRVDEGNAWRTTNMLRNLTLQTGDNPGCYGVFFMGANNTGIRNVTLEGAPGLPSNGVYGVKFSSGGNIGYHYDITVNGFQHALYLLPYENFHHSFEFLTLRNQTVSGIHLVDATASIRKLFSQQTIPGVPAVRLENSPSQAVIIDSECHGIGSAAILLDHDFQAAYASTYDEFGPPYVQHFNGHAFCRDIVVTGYDNAVEMDEGATSRFAPIRPLPWEFVSDKLSTYKEHRADNGRGVSLRLPIEESPQPPTTTFDTSSTDVAIVEDYYLPADGTTLFDLDGKLDNRVPDPGPGELFEAGDEVPDYTAAIDRAMNSGRPIVFFPGQIYRSTGTPGQNGTLIPETVKQVIGFFGEGFGVPLWRVAPSSQPDDPVLIDDMWSAGSVIVMPGNGTTTHTRPVALNHCRGGIARGDAANSGVKIFMNSCNSYGGSLTALNNTDNIWMRMVNTENGGKQAGSPRVIWNAEGSTNMWCLGFKIEGGFTTFQAADGARVEVLGGALLQQSLLELTTNGIDRSRLPQFRIDDSNGSPNARLSVVASAAGPSNAFFTRIIERRKPTFTPKYPTVLDLTLSPAADDNKIEETSRTDFVPRKALHDSGNFIGQPIPKNHIIPLFSTQQSSAAPALWLESPLAKTLIGPLGARDIAFTDQLVGSTTAHDFRVNNIGTADLTITSASITGGDTADFTLDTSAMITPVPQESGSSPLVVHFHPTTVGPRQATLTLATNDPTEPTITITLQGTGFTPASAYASWTVGEGLTGNDTLADATPYNDGIANLLKYGFNIPMTGDVWDTVTPNTGTSGLPAVTNNGGTHLRIEFLRRRNSGLIYTPQFSTTLTGFDPISSTPVVTAIDESWERVVILEPIPPGATHRFIRVQVQLP